MEYKFINQEELEFIRDNYKIMSNKQLASELNRSVSSVNGLLHRHQLKRRNFSRKPRKEKQFSEYSVNPSCFIKDFTPESVYILGLLWGDGSLYKDSITLKCVMSDISEYMPIFLKTGNWKCYNIKHKPNCKDAPSGTINTNNKIISKFLYEINFDKKSYTSPDLLLNILPENLIKYFFRGYIDADGCFYFNKRRQFSISSTYNQDWNFIERLFSTMNIKYTKYTTITKKGHRASYIRCCNKKDITKIGTFIYDNYENDKIGLSRKYNKWKSML